MDHTPVGIAQVSANSKVVFASELAETEPTERDSLS